MVRKEAHILRGTRVDFEPTAGKRIHGEESSPLTCLLFGNPGAREMPRRGTTSAIAMRWQSKAQHAHSMTGPSLGFSAFVCTTGRSLDPVHLSSAHATPGFSQDKPCAALRVNAVCQARPRATLRSQDRENGRRKKVAAFVLRGKDDSAVLPVRWWFAEVDKQRQASNKPAKRTSKKVAGASERWPSSNVFSRAT